jgi:hypothetical protein
VVPDTLHTGSPDNLKGVKSEIAMIADSCINIRNRMSDWCWHNHSSGHAAFITDVYGESFACGLSNQ